MPEVTFESLRYSFRRRPPQSNYPPDTVPSRFTVRFRQRLKQGRYFKGDSTKAGAYASKSPAYPTHHLAKSMSSCSKGSRGLSVPPRVAGIFTGTTISPSPWLRQYPSRCTIRAGRNLPDKEFRYLRTVIVTAAVYRGFNSMSFAAEAANISFLNLPAPGRCQAIYIIFQFSIEHVFLINSRLDLFTATFPRF